VKHYKKGQYGYRDYHKKIEFGKVCMGAVVILLQLAVREFVDSSSLRNLLTVTAILSVLPIARIASPLLASWRWKTPSVSFYKQMASYEGNYRILYDLIITSKDSLMPMDAIVVHPTGVYAYCTAKKLDTGKAELFFRDRFLGQKLDSKVKLIQEENVFFKRLNDLQPAFAKEDSCLENTITLLKSLSM
jgi:hypothetical protein